MSIVNEQLLNSNSSAMKSFGIADLERLSGVKAHTLRMWEKRYEVPISTRDNSGARQYSLKEMKRILLIALLNRYGFKISHLASLSEEEILKKVQRLNDDDCIHQLTVYQLFFCMYAFDVDGYEKLVDNCFTKWSAYIVIGKIIYPFLKYSCLLWGGSHLTEEHLVVTILRKKMLHCIEQLCTTCKPKKTALLFLSDSSQLDLSLLYACYLLQYFGVKVIYMGNDVSISNLSVLFDSMKPDFLYTYLPRKNNFSFEKLASIMDEKLPNGKLMVTMQTNKELMDALPDNIVITLFNEAMEIIKESCVVGN